MWWRCWIGLVEEYVLVDVGRKVGYGFGGWWEVEGVEEGECGVYLMDEVRYGWLLGGLVIEGLMLKGMLKEGKNGILNDFQG